MTNAARNKLLTRGAEPAAWISNCHDVLLHYIIPTFCRQPLYLYGIQPWRLYHHGFEKVTNSPQPPKDTDVMRCLVWTRLTISYSRFKMWSTQKIEKVQTDVILTASALFLFCTGVLVLHEKCTRFQPITRVSFCRVYHYCLFKFTLVDPSWSWMLKFPHLWDHHHYHYCYCYKLCNCHMIFTHSQSFTVIIIILLILWLLFERIFSHYILE